jgi:hypothetical protein
MQSLVNKARLGLLYKMSKPWGDEGSRVMPNVLFAEFANQFREIQREFEHERDLFVPEYPALVAAAPQRLNGLFNAADYPPVDQIASRFKLDYGVLPFPEIADDFRADIDDDLADEIRTEIQNEVRRGMNHMQNATFEQIQKVVGHMAETLGEYKPAKKDKNGRTLKGERSEGVFRDTLVENVRELSKLLPAFNLTGDKNLDAIAERIDSELCGEDAETLRNNEVVRATVQKSAEEILAEVCKHIA